MGMGMRGIGMGGGICMGGMGMDSINMSSCSRLDRVLGREAFGVPPPRAAGYPEVSVRYDGSRGSAAAASVAVAAACC